jgi:hypothetical protein
MNPQIAISATPAWFIAMEILFDVGIFAHGLSLVLFPRIYDRPHWAWNPTYFRWAIGKRKLLGWFCIAVSVFFLWFSAIPKLFPAIGLTLSSTRTPPALPSALSQLPASSAPLSASAQAGPVSFIR